MRIISALLLAVGIAAGSTLAAASPRDELTQKIEQLKAKPSDNALREAIIKLALSITPPPAVPEAAHEKFVEGNTIAKSAKGPSGQKLAIKRYQDALLIAPWWGDAYYNLGTAQELAGLFGAAKASFKLYILTNPGEKEARDAQDRIYALNAKADLAKAEKADAAVPKSSVAKAAPPPPASDPAEVKRAEEAQRWNGRWKSTSFLPAAGQFVSVDVQSAQNGTIIEFGPNLEKRWITFRGTISASGAITWELNSGAGRCGMRPLNVTVSPDYKTLEYSVNMTNVSTCEIYPEVSTIKVTRQ